MRTLKRLMCLVLALVMVLGLCVTSVSAVTTEFSDIEQSNHKEAVMVLNALGIIEGYNYTDEVRPQENLTRAQAAKIVTLLTGNDLTNQVLVSSFTDVHGVAGLTWAEPFIAFCQNEKIIIGRDDGMFHPNDKVTGAEFAKMMLCALGYDATKEKLANVGNAWVINTTTLASRAKINTDLDKNFDYNDAITRDNAMQLALNTLKADMVYYDDFSFDNGGSIVSVFGKAKRIEYNDELREDNYYQGPELTGWHYRQLCEDAFPTLKLNEEDEQYTRDDFYRPGKTWIYNKETVVFVANNGTYYPSGTFTGTHAKALLRNVKNKPEKIEVYYNGNPTEGTEDPTFQEDKTAPEDESGAWWDDKTGINGYEVYVYPTDEGGYEVIIREAYVAQVTAATREGNDITLTVYEIGLANTEGDDQWAFDEGGAEYVVKYSDNPSLYNTLARYEDEAYVAVYLRPGWDDPEYDCKDILEIRSLKEEAPVVITWIEDNGKKTLSYLLVDDKTDSKYSINNEAMWTDGDDLWLANVVKGSGGDVRATDVGAAVLYTLDGKVLLVRQDEPAANTGLTFGYLIDYMAVSGSLAGDNWTPDWEESFGYKLTLKLRLPDGSDAIFDWMIPNDEYDEDDNPDVPEYIIQRFEHKEDAEALGDALLNLLYEYDPDTGLITLVAGDENELAVGDLIDEDYDFKEAKVGTALDDYKWPKLGYPAYSGNANIAGAAVAPDENAEENKVDVKYNRAAGTLGDNDQVIFDSKTIIFVANTLSKREQKNAKLDIYSGIMDPDLANRQDGTTATKGMIVNGEDTYIQYVWDGGEDGDGTNGSRRVIAVLIALPGPDAADPDVDDDLYFVMITDGATLNKKYTDSTHTAEIEYYSPAATINHELQDKGTFEGSKDLEKPHIYFGYGAKYDDYGLFADIDDVNLAANTDYQITKIEWNSLNKAFNITDGDENVIGCLANANLKIFYFDIVNGTIETMTVSQVTSKMGQNMVGFMDINKDSREITALYLTILPDSYGESEEFDYTAFLAMFVGE